jgi:hypothetical protein
LDRVPPCRRGRDAPKIVGYNPESKIQNPKSETEAAREKKEKRHRGVCRDQITRTGQRAQDARRDRCRARATAGGRHSGAGPNCMGQWCKTGSTAWVQAAVPGLASSRDAIPGCALWAPETKPPSLCVPCIAAGIALWESLALAMLICERPGSQGCRPCQPNWASSSEGRARSRARRRSSSLPQARLRISSTQTRTASHRTARPAGRP